MGKFIRNLVRLVAVVGLASVFAAGLTTVGVPFMIGQVAGLMWFGQSVTFE